MNPVILICSRRASSRLPEKALRPIAGRSPIRHILGRVCGHGVPVVLCVPPDEEDAYVAEAQGTEASVYLGNPDSPLHRMADYILSHPAYDWVIRITHDDAIIHWPTVARMLDAAMKADSNIGYITSPGIVDGAGVELIHADNLLYAASAHQEPTEFVSYFVRGSNVPRVGHLRIEPEQGVKRDYRLTMDYPEDATLIGLVLRRLGMDATAPEICSYLDQHQDLLNINRQPDISFYTCARNAEKWIGEAIRSVHALGIGGIEYVVVDDGSTDKTAEIIAAHMCLMPYLRLVANPHNMGLASSSNVALKNCRGKFVMRIDADDRLSTNALPGIMRMYGADADAVYPAFSKIGESGAILSYQNDPSQDHHMGGALLRKSVLNEIRFRDGLRHWDGLELYERLKKTGAKIAYSDDVTWHYRQRGDSMSNSEPVKRAAMRASILGPIQHE